MLIYGTSRPGISCICLTYTCKLLLFGQSSSWPYALYCRSLVSIFSLKVLCCLSIFFCGRMTYVYYTTSWNLLRRGRCIWNCWYRFSLQLRRPGIWSGICHLRDNCSCFCMSNVFRCWCHCSAVPCFCSWWSSLYWACKSSWVLPCCGLGLCGTCCFFRSVCLLMQRTSFLYSFVHSCWMGVVPQYFPSALSGGVFVFCRLFEG